MEAPPITLHLFSMVHGPPAGPTLVSTSPDRHFESEAGARTAGGAREAGPERARRELGAAAGARGPPFKEAPGGRGLSPARPAAPGGFPDPLPRAEASGGRASRG